MNARWCMLDFMKLILLIIMALILVALFTGLFFLVKEEDGNSKKALQSLMVRVGLSLLLIFLIVLSFYMGWIVPHPVGG